MCPNLVWCLIDFQQWILFDPKNKGRYVKCKNERGISILCKARKCIKDNKSSVVPTTCIPILWWQIKVICKMTGSKKFSHTVPLLIGFKCSDLTMCHISLQTFMCKFYHKALHNILSNFSTCNSDIHSSDIGEQLPCAMSWLTQTRRNVRSPHTRSKLAVTYHLVHTYSGWPYRFYWTEWYQ